MLRTRGPNESVDEFFSVLNGLHKEIAENGGNTSTKTLCRRFILNLGPDFSDIHTMYATNRLPTAWNTENSNVLLPLAYPKLSARLQGS